MSAVQTVLVPRSWGLRKAKSWLLAAGYKYKKVDVAANYYRFRQVPPRFRRYITRPLSNGVLVVIGYP